jgi:hypothetical protein
VFEYPLVLAAVTASTKEMILGELAGDTETVIASFVVKKARLTRKTAAEAVDNLASLILLKLM